MLGFLLPEKRFSVLLFPARDPPRLVPCGPPCSHDYAPCPQFSSSKAWNWTSCVFLHNILPEDKLKTKMALKVDDVSPQLASKFTSSSFDPEKCEAGKETRNLITAFHSFHDSLSVEQPSFLQSK